MTNVILLVEDNEDHAELIKQILESDDTGKEIHWVKDGQEALDFLYRKESYQNAPRPSLVLLDINLPKLSGLEVLKDIKENKDFQIIPVVMLTTSDRDEEILQCYHYGANSFVTKPVKFDAYFEKMQNLEQYWLMTNKSPNDNSAT